jgi:gluconolactonase
MRFTSLILVLSIAIAGWSATALAGVRTINPRSFYPEGPLWHDGKLFYVEYAKSRVMTWDGKENKQYWKQDGCGANGLAELPGDAIIVACYDANTLVEVDANAKTIRTISKDSAGRPFLGPNDFCRDAKGGLYFSASGVYDVKAPIEGKVYYIARDGNIKLLADTIHYANGLSVTRDGKALLVTEMLADRILSFDIGPDGSLGARKVWARLQDIAPIPPGADAYNGPDGVKVGQDGLVYIAHNGSARVLVTDANAKLVRKIDVPAKYVTNVNFGPTVSTLYITAAIDANNPPYPGEVYQVTP